MRRSLVHSRKVRIDGSRPFGKSPQVRRPVMSVRWLLGDAVSCVSIPLRRCKHSEWRRALCRKTTRCMSHRPKWRGPGRPRPARWSGSGRQDLRFLLSGGLFRHDPEKLLSLGRTFQVEVMFADDGLGVARLNGGLADGPEFGDEHGNERVAKHIMR